MVDVPAHLAAAAFDALLKRGDIIHFHWEYRDENGDNAKNKFAVVLNRDLPDDPILVVLATSKVAFYNTTALYDADIIRVAVGTYKCFTKDTVISFRKIEKLDIDDLRKQFAIKQLTIVEQLLKVHTDQANQIIRDSRLIEGWKKKRCTPADEKPAAARPEAPKTD